MTKYQGWDEWAKKFKPVKNHLSKYKNEILFETFGEEAEFVQKSNHKYVWTILQGDMLVLIGAGYHSVNRLGHYITEVPWEDEFDSALISVEEECECYNEEDNDGEFADSTCPECEGHGYVTKYVGGQFGGQLP